MQAKQPCINKVIDFIAINLKIFILFQSESLPLQWHSKKTKTFFIRNDTINILINTKHYTLNKFFPLPLVFYYCIKQRKWNKKEKKRDTIINK